MATTSNPPSTPAASGATAEKKAATIIRIPLHTIIVVRGEKQIVPPIGKPFPFTADEVASIQKANKGALRKPINEGAEEVSFEDQARESEASASTSDVDPTGTARRASTRNKAAAASDEI